MKGLLIVMVVVAVSFASPEPAAAQQRSVFVMAGISSDVNDQHFPSIGGGVLFDVASSWISVGGRGDIFFSGGYVAGRGGPITQVSLLRHRRVRPFALGGYAWGEEAGPMLGAGVDVEFRNGISVRVSVQDYFAQVGGTDCGFLGMPQSYCDTLPHAGRPYTGHQLSVQAGLVWR